MTSMLLLRLARLACDAPTMRFEPGAAHATIPRLRPTHTYVTGGPARRRGATGVGYFPYFPRWPTDPPPGHDQAATLPADTGRVGTATGDRGSGRAARRRRVTYSDQQLRIRLWRQAVAGRWDAAPCDGCGRHIPSAYFVTLETPARA